MRGALAAGWVVVACGVAVAQPQDRDKSTRLFNEGRELAKQNKWAPACERFEQSLQIDRAPGTSLNYGDCLEHLGQLRKAFQMYDSAARDFGRDKDPRAKFARQRADAVVPKLAKIVIKLAEPRLEGLVVTIGGTSVAVRADLVELVEPGDITVKATAPGRGAFTSRASGVAGAQVIVEIPALPAGGASTVVDAPAATRIPSDSDDPDDSDDSDAPTGVRRQRQRVIIAASVGGAGVVSLLVSSYLGLTAKSRYDDATAANDRIAIEAAGARADKATVFAVIGGALVAGGVVLYVTAPREQFVLAPTGSSTSVGLAFSGRF